MPVGDFEATLFQKPAAVFLARTFGAKGVHDHLRIAPLLRYASKHWRGRDLRVLEVGCGEGLSLFELAKVLGPRMSAQGYDFDPVDIGLAQRVAAASFAQLQFYCKDAATLVDLGEVFDVILFMDFLEHVSDPAAIIAKLAPCLRPGGEVIVSVPTPRYPLIFTRDMHDRIGHLVEGYTEETLRRLFPPAFTMSLISRNTGIPAQWGCWIQARQPRLGYAGGWVLSVVLTSIFRRMDWFNGPRSCSLFAVFKKS